MSVLASRSGYSVGHSPHKHAALGPMLTAALPIIEAASRKGFSRRGMPFSPPLLIDTHAGPGIWADGVEGSPILLAESAPGVPRRLILCELKRVHREALAENMSECPWPVEIHDDYRTTLAALAGRPCYGDAPYGLVNIDPSGANDLELDLIAEALQSRYLGYCDVLLHASETAQRRAGHQTLEAKRRYLERIGFVFQTYDFPGDHGRSLAWRWKLSFGSRWRNPDYLRKVAASAFRAGLVEPGRLFS